MGATLNLSPKEGLFGGGGLRSPLRASLEFDHNVACLGVELERMDAAFTPMLLALARPKAVRKSRRNQLLIPQAHFDLACHVVRLFEVMNVQQITDLSPTLSPDVVVSYSKNSARLQSRTVILAAGELLRSVGCTGERKYRNKGTLNCPNREGLFFKGKDVTVSVRGNVRKMEDMSSKIRIQIVAR